MTILSIGSREGDYRKRKVRCPNASWLGYGQRDAYPGCWITYTQMIRPWPDPETGEQKPDFPSTEVARVFASVTPLTRIDPDEPKGYLAVVTLAADLEFGMLRWVDPKDVTRVLDPSKEGHPDPAKILAWVAGPQFNQTSPEMMLRLLEYGTMSSQFIEQAEHHVKAWKAGVSPAVYKEEEPT